MKVTLITAALLCASNLIHAAPDASSYKITSDGPTKFQVDISLSPQSAPGQYSAHTTTGYAKTCTDLALTQGSVTTGTSIVLNQSDYLKTVDANIVRVTLTNSELIALKTVETSRCAVQQPEVRSFTSSVIVKLPMGAKQQIAKDFETGENWFIQRTR